MQIAWLALAAATLPAAACGGPPATEPTYTVEKKAWAAPLYAMEEAEGTPSARGRIRVRREDWYEMEPYEDDRDYLGRLRRADLRIEGLQPDRYYVFEVLRPESSPEAFATGSDGRARLSLGRGLDMPLPGTTVLVRDPSGPVLMAGVVPDWKHRPGIRDGATAEFEGPGGLVVRVGRLAIPGRGIERLRFRIEGLAPGEPVGLVLGDDPERTVVAGPGGRAAFSWDSTRERRLPCGASSVAALEGRPFEVRSGGFPLLEGAIP